MGERDYIGRPLPMIGAERLTKGQGRFVADLPTAAGHVAFVRSPIAHGRISRLDLEAARAHPEAEAVLVAQDLESIVVGRYWGGWEETSTGDYFPLVQRKVRWTGEPVALVVASSRAAAEDIAELVEAEYEPLPAVVDAAVAVGDDPPALLYEEWGHNVYYRTRSENGDTEKAFADAANTISRTFSSQRHTGTPLETRGLVVDFDPGRRKLIVQINHQDVYLFRTVLSGVLDLAPGQIHVSSVHTGGGFGVKLPVYPEELACCAAAIRLGRPLRWIQDRQEDLLGTTQHRDLVVEIEAAHDAQGKVLGIRSRFLSDAGAYGIPARGNAVEGMMAAEDLTGPYAIQDYDYELTVAMTNKAPLCVYRGVGQPVSIFVMESLMDDVARAVGIDRIEVRRRNLISEFPYHSVTGYVMEPGSYLEALEAAADEVGLDRFQEERKKAQSDGRLIGLGIACANEASARGAEWYGQRGVPISGQEGCQIKIDPTGRVNAYLGTTNQGQGIETALAQLIADELSVAIDQIYVFMGDTESTPYGAGAWASRQMTIGGSAASRAAQALRAKLTKIAASELECSEDDLEMSDGTLSVKGSPSQAVTVRELAELAYFRASDLPEGLEPTLEETAHFDPPAATFSNSAHAVVAEVDPETGKIEILRYVAVDDCGRVVNPLIVSGQLAGGVAQGIGGTVYEHLVYDEEGQPLATTFMDYLIPSSLDLPELEVKHLETPSPLTARGIKGIGETGTCFAPAALALAVADALGVDVGRLELSPSRVFELCERSELASVGG